MSAIVLVVGATGVFGSRLVERLALTSDATILLAGRSAAKIDALIERLAKRSLKASLQSCVVDRNKVSAAVLRSLGVHIVVDAAGPFQGQDLLLPQSAIDAGCHFIDLADARDYVARFPTLDAAAQRAGILAVCGASSTPAISHASLDQLVTQFARLDEVSVYISPGNRAPRGVSVMSAILSYVGKPVRIREQGETRDRPGWSLLHRRRLPELSPRWFSLCETPDLDLIPERFASVRTAKFYAGLELALLHCGLWMLSWLVRMRILRSLTPYAAVLHRVASWFEPFGTDRGGMLVEASGCDTHGAALVARWGLVAEAGDGPYIPVLPAVALIRKLINHGESTIGAQACVGLLTLEEICREFEGLRIRTFSEVSSGRSLFARVLGDAFKNMPSAVRSLHAVCAPTTFVGVASVEGASTFVGSMIARMFGFPSTTLSCQARVVIEPHDQYEVWRREFAGKVFKSRLTATGMRGTVFEQFGPFRFLLKLDSDESGLSMSVEGARLGFIPMPRFLFPWTIAHERVDEQGRFTFHVEIGLPLLGRIVRYRGWLERSSRARM